MKVSLDIIQPMGGNWVIFQELGLNAEGITEIKGIYFTSELEKPNKFIFEHVFNIFVFNIICVINIWTCVFEPVSICEIATRQ